MQPCMKGSCPSSPQVGVTGHASTGGLHLWSVPTSHIPVSPTPPWQVDVTDHASMHAMLHELGESQLGMVGEAGERRPDWAVVQGERCVRCMHVLAQPARPVTALCCTCQLLCNTPGLNQV